MMVACGDAATVGDASDAVHDAGEDVGEVDAGMLGAAGAVGTAAGSSAGNAGSIGAAGAAGTAGSGAAGTTGAAGAAAGAGAGGAAGSAGGAAGSGAAGAAAGTGGGSAAGAGGGSGGGVQSYACPLGSTDADGNGYPDACETVISTIALAKSSTSYTSAYYVLQRGLSPADSAKYPDCNQAINAVGQAYPIHTGTAETRIFDVRTDANLQAFIACEQTFLAHPNGVSKLTPLYSQLLFNVHSTWPQDRTGTGSNQYTNSSIMATLTPTFTIVYAKREVIAYTSDSFSGRWTLHGYRTPK